MTWKLIGKGSQYAWGYLDSKGQYLDGGKNYTLNLPGDAPAERFMSIVVYDSQTRSMLQTDQPYPNKNNKRDKLITNDDGSIDLYFGPKPPEESVVEMVGGNKRSLPSRSPVSQMGPTTFTISVADSSARLRFTIS